MTRVVYDPGSWTLSMEGHAGAAPRGQDLVCAGLSVLMYTLAEAVMNHREALMPTVVFEDGVFRVQCRPSRRSRGLCRQIYETIYTGLCLLSEQYPAYVETRRTEQEG